MTQSKNLIDLPEDMLGCVLYSLRKHIMLVCKGLGICCARLPRQASGTAGRRAEEGGATRSSRGGAREGRVGSEERGAPECCGISGSRDQVWSVT